MIEERSYVDVNRLIDPTRAIWPARGSHRGEHLDELETAVRASGAERR